MDLKRLLKEYCTSQEYLENVRAMRIMSKRKRARISLMFYCAPPYISNNNNIRSSLSIGLINCGHVNNEIFLNFHNVS